MSLSQSTVIGEPAANNLTPRIGTDLVSVAEVDRSISAFGNRYLDRVYTELERAQTGSASERMAARFAGKEAVMKVLRIPAGVSVPFHDIEIASLPSGAPHVRLRGAAMLWAEGQHLKRLTVSLSHQSGTALAVALGDFADPHQTTSEKVRDALANYGELTIPVDELHDDDDLYVAGLAVSARMDVMLALEDAAGIVFPDALAGRETFASLALIVSATDSVIDARPRDRGGLATSAPEKNRP